MGQAGYTAAMRGSRAAMRSWSSKSKFHSQAVRGVDDLFEGGAALGDVSGGAESGADRPATTLG
ncbi:MULTISPECIES: hypothetical protein [unclassified Streptomyces]|uniref:hypothetical protein n=1 Tax=unclassified Streptomyces TaxID=2593676 RepID=UPI002E79A38D|nr:MULTISPECIES: hypothetical protein [unclassified Streptomyces]MEE1758670.1 hypothetical protein [Streptomyces sp. SP18BB07]MEE1831015.1 hypothetical protein [Streptomyces sp. SP17KL33]